MRRNDSTSRFARSWRALAAAGILAGAARVVLAADCDPCASYARFIEHYRLANSVAEIGLAESVAAIGTNALETQGRTFAFQPEIADALKRQIRADERIPAECRPYLAGLVHSGPRASLVMTGTLGAAGIGARPPGFDLTYGVVQNEMNMFTSLVGKYDSCSSLRGNNAGYLSCLEKNAAMSYQKFTSDMANSSTQTIISQLAQLGYTASAGDVALLRSFTAAIDSGSKGGLRAWGANAVKTLGVDGFLTAVQMLGWQMNTMYNELRASNTGTAGQGIVSVDQMLASMKSGAMFLVQGPNGWSDPAHALAYYAGVCRDAAVVQVQALEAAGFPNSYVSCYRTAGAGHCDTITQDPGDPHRLYLINWFGRETRQDLDGGQALFQGGGGSIPDYSMVYRLYDGTGRAVASVPSEMGKFLNEVAGGDVAAWDPLARTNNSILAASISPDKTGLIQIRGLYGTDGNGASYFGGAVSAHWGQGTHFPGEAGFFAGQQLRPADIYQESSDGTAGVEYLQAAQHAITPAVKLGAGASGVLDTHLVVAGQLTEALSGPDVSNTGSNVNGDGDVRLGTVARIDQKAVGGKLQAQYFVGGDMSFGPSDVRNQSLGSVLTPMPVDLYAGARATLDVGGVKLFGQTTAVLDQLGAREKTEVGVASRSIAASVYEAGRITNQTALLEDNSIRRVGASVTAQPTKWLRLGVTGEIPLEGDQPLQNFRLWGTGAVLF